ncbi:MAG TPA: universal stress protein [Acidimicrobiia bacterium]
MAIVVGVDSSPHAVSVLERAILEAERRTEELHVVHVFHPPVVYLEIPIDLVTVAEAERGAVWAPLNQSISDAGSTVKKIDLEGYPPDTLVDYAKDVDASLLVVGSRGRGELASLILGSTSHRAIHLAPCDVLVVKPQSV